MLIEAKEKPLYFYGGIAAVVSGVFLLYYLMTYHGAAGDFLTVFGKILSVVLIVFGVVYLVKYDRYKQAVDLLFDIREGKLFLNDMTYALENAYLTVSYTKSDELFRTSLWLEKDGTTVEIFKHAVLNLEEMANFLTLIKPYRKSDLCLSKEEVGKIRLFEGGFAFENREIFYNEVEKFDTQWVKMSGQNFLDIHIVLKNSEQIDKRLVDGTQEYAKALYASMLFNRDEPLNFSLLCPPKSYLGYIVLISDLITVGLIVYNEKFLPLGAVMLFVTTLYVSFNANDERMLCKEIEKIHNEQTGKSA